MDRSELSKCLAKVIAYKNVGNDKEASVWAKKLVKMLRENGVDC